MVAAVVMVAVQSMLATWQGAEAACAWAWLRVSVCSLMAAGLPPPLPMAWMQACVMSEAAAGGAAARNPSPDI
jgi:hypothetical protein